MPKLLPMLFASLFAAAVAADETVLAVDPVGLPVLGGTWRDDNPYRGLPDAVAVGRTAYAQACARCHGADAATNAAPAPDLRQLDRTCRRIVDAALRAACMRDNDAYFARTVRDGKVIVGVRHMPAWDGLLRQELAWAIQVFVESRARGE